MNVLISGFLLIFLVFYSIWFRSVVDCIVGICVFLSDIMPWIDLQIVVMNTNDHVTGCTMDNL